MRSIPGASAYWPLKRVTRPSARARSSRAISSGSLCAANCVRVASGLVQKSYSAAAAAYPYLPYGTLVTVTP